MTRVAESPGAPALPDACRTERLHEPLVLHRGPAVLRHGQTKEEIARGDTEIRVEMLPSPRVCFAINEAQFNPHNVLEAGELELPGLATASGVLVLGAQINSRDDPPPSVTGLFNEPFRIGSGEEMDRVSFRVLNLKDIRGERIRRSEDERSSWRGRATLQFGPWVATLDSARDHAHRWREVCGVGGFAWTHAGQLNRGDGAAFNADQADDAMDFLDWILSFVNGAHVGQGPATGYAGEQLVWQDWSVRRVERAKDLQTRSWYCEGAWEQCLGLASTAWDYRSEDWFSLAIGLYLQANVLAGGRETALILAQTDLELLAGVILVEDRAILSPDGFKKLSAADKIRLLLGLAGIPAALPATLPNLAKLAKSWNAQDGPDTITRLRNKFTHADAANRQTLAKVSNDDGWQAVHLALWYVELLLLWKLGYPATAYSCRLDPQSARSLPEVVPWARTK